MKIKVNSELSQTIQDIDFTGSTAANSELVKAILLLAHPVGSYYWSSDSTNPATLFGGTWTQIKDKFIIAVGDNHTAGTSYGSNTKNLAHTHTSAAHTHSTGNHTLTSSEIPKHTHESKSLTGYTELRDTNTTDHNTAMQSSGIVSNSYVSWDGTHAGLSSVSMTDYKKSRITINATHEHSSVGGGGAHSHGNTGSTTPGATGSSLSSSFDVTPACIAAYCWRRTA